jgi:hypothetical protein
VVLPLRRCVPDAMDSRRVLLLHTASGIKPTCFCALVASAVHEQEKSWLRGHNRFFAPTMSASWSKIHEDLNTSAFYQRVKLRAPIWQRLQRGGMFLAVTAVLVPFVVTIVACVLAALC